MAQSNEGSAQRAQGGTVLRGQDGALYFVRDELLPALKVEGEGLQRLEEALGAKDFKEVEHFAPAKDGGSGTRAIGYVRGSLLAKDPRNNDMKSAGVSSQSVPSTIMCPWFC